MDGIIRYVVPPLRSMVLFLAALHLVGCAFFVPPPDPPPDPSLDGLLQCGETVDFALWPEGENLVIDVATFTSVQALAVFDNPGSGLRLVAESDLTRRRAVEVWDPILERRTVTGFRGSDEVLELELIRSTDFPVTGTVSLECTDPGEVCFNLQDDDGDGAIDCADLHCAGDSNCIEDQEDLEELVLSCNEDFESIPVPSLGMLDDQRTLYSTGAGGPDAPSVEFRGGAEVVILAAAGASVVEFRFGGPGLLCPGEIDETSISCTGALSVSEGQSVSLKTSEFPIWLEPESSAWPTLEARVHCDDG